MAIRLLLLLLLAFPAFADDTEQRARALGQEVRCLVCQAQSIEDSNAQLAADLRRFIRAEIISGKSDDEIRTKLRATYGNQILLRPPVTGQTVPLWAAPVVLLVVALLMARRMVRRRTK